VHRTLTFINNQFEGKLPEPHELDERDLTVKTAIEEAPSKIGSFLDKCEQKAALAGIIELARVGNQYLSEREPWHLIKTDRARTATTLYLATQLVRSIGILIAPFLPETAEQIHRQLNLDSRTERWWDAGQLDLKPGHLISKPNPLFHKVAVPKQS